MNAKAGHGDREACSYSVGFAESGAADDDDDARGHDVGDGGVDGKVGSAVAVADPGNDQAEEKAMTLLLPPSGRAHRGTTRALAKPLF